MEVSNSLVGAAETAAPPFECSDCLVGAVLALASGEAERRQLHPLTAPPEN